MWSLPAAAESDKTGERLEGHGQWASSSPALAEKKNKKQDVLQSSELSPPEIEITWSPQTLKNISFDVRFLNAVVAIYVFLAG